MQSNQEPHLIRPSFHITIIMSHEGHTAGIIIHRLPLGSVIRFAKRKELFNRANPHHHGNEEKDTLFWLPCPLPHFTGLLLLPESLSPDVDNILGTHKQKSVLPHKRRAEQMRTHTCTVCVVTAKGGKEFSSGEK